MPTKIAFTICSNNYLAQAKTLGDSLKKHNPEISFYIGLADKLNPDIDYSFFSPHTIVPYETIGYNTDFDEMVVAYDIVEFNTSVKPFYFEYFFQKENAQNVLYIDPDIKIFDNLEDITKLFDSFDFILTPHKLYPHVDNLSPFETLVSNVGIFNFGFLGLKKTKETETFLKWWKNRLKKYCKIDFPNGLFVDQKWADFIPTFFDKVCILKNPACNMGYWNFDERVLSKVDNKYIVNEKFKLLFFHFSSYNPLLPEKLCKWLGYSFTERMDLQEIYEDYRIELMENKYDFFERKLPLIELNKNHQTLGEQQQKPSIKQKVGVFLKKNIDLIFETNKS